METYYDFEKAELVGSFCTLIYPYRNQTEGTIEEDYGSEVVVRLINNRRVILPKDEVIVYD